MVPHFLLRKTSLKPVSTLSGSCLNNFQAWRSSHTCSVPLASLASLAIAIWRQGHCLLQCSISVFLGHTLLSWGKTTNNGKQQTKGKPDWMAATASTDKSVQFKAQWAVVHGAASSKNEIFIINARYVFGSKVNVDVGQHCEVGKRSRYCSSAGLMSSICDSWQNKLSWSYPASLCKDLPAALTMWSMFNYNRVFLFLSWEPH